MYKHLHFLIVPTSEHLNFTVNNGFAFGGEHQVSHPTGGGRHSRLHGKLGCREPACRQPHGSGEEPLQGKVSPGGAGVGLRDFALCNAVCATGMGYHTAPHRITPGRVAVL